MYQNSLEIVSTSSGLIFVSWSLWLAIFAWLAIFGWMDEHEIHHFIEDYMYSNNPERLSGLPKARTNKPVSVP